MDYEELKTIIQSGNIHNIKKFYVKNNVDNYSIYKGLQLSYYFESYTIIEYILHEYRNYIIKYNTVNRPIVSNLVNDIIIHYIYRKNI